MTRLISIFRKKQLLRSIDVEKQNASAGKQRRAERRSAALQRRSKGVQGRKPENAAERRFSARRARKQRNSKRQSHAKRTPGKLPLNNTRRKRAVAMRQRHTFKTELVERRISALQRWSKDVQRRNPTHAAKSRFGTRRT